LYLGDVGVLIHELRNLVDGSLRCLSLARRSLCSSDAWATDPQAERVHRQLGAAATALEQMSGLVYAAMQGSSMPLGSPALAGDRPVTLSEAIEHAVEVMRPAANELGVTINTTVTEPAGILACGGLYLVILNVLRNSVESIERCSTGERPPGGAIHVQARTENFDMRSAKPRPMIALEITDDGQGPPQGADLARVFEPGFSKKAGGTGLGLAACKSIVDQAGGTIVLLRRREARDPGRPGALLRICLPTPNPPSAPRAQP
jgi:signal transduction histidine kinase